ncbi:MAG: GNAT family N-acetyltransferase [Sandaracinaceae bacterium]|nr:GNAT family N-acetyltransferase [Sandaracinaceae bacterium]
MDIAYALEPELDVDAFRDVLVRSTLGLRRPIDDRERLTRMLANADLIVTARHDGLLVGIARSITDYAYCTYLSDLAVDAAYQRRGIGKRLVEETRKLAGEDCGLVLIAAPAARDYYGKIGLRKNDACWSFPRGR